MTISYTVVPVFFVSIGPQADARDGGNRLPSAGVAAAAVVSKIIGSGLGARLGLAGTQARRAGVGMVSRGRWDRSSPQSSQSGLVGPGAVLGDRGPCLVDDDPDPDAASGLPQGAPSRSRSAPSDGLRYPLRSSPPCWISAIRHDLVRAWEEAGVTGATILDKHRDAASLKQLPRDDLLLMPSLRLLLDRGVQPPHCPERGPG
jgi:hypothetical protein